MKPSSLFGQARRKFHANILRDILKLDDNKIPGNADKDNKSSVAIARGLLEKLGSYSIRARLKGQVSGHKFESIVAEFLKATFLELGHLRPGHWDVSRTGGRNRLLIAQYEQYERLEALSLACKDNPALAAIMGSDYTITPDIVISRAPESDASINRVSTVVDDSSALLASLRAKNNELPILHASISCKWTIRSDRAQNSRTEGLNLVRNRKGRLPHVAVVTAEPLPSRISSIALGTGDIDCVYHFALNELSGTVSELELDDTQDMLRIMIEGRRLRDISDLPLDLAV